MKTESLFLVGCVTVVMVKLSCCRMESRENKGMMEGIYASVRLKVSEVLFRSCCFIRWSRHQLSQCGYGFLLDEMVGVGGTTIVVTTSLLWLQHISLLTAVSRAVIWAAAVGFSLTEEEKEAEDYMSNHIMFHR